MLGPVESHLLEMMIGRGIKRGGDTPASPHCRGPAKRISPAESSPACYNDPITHEPLSHNIVDNFCWWIMADEIKDVTKKDGLNAALLGKVIFLLLYLFYAELFFVCCN